ncbi:hypothetical protein [Bermanella sp. R86510]|uniref:hypothetical protein n=1 Tax=unclassified Bermanella TaxID=2627862 RepID=UPI0037C76611
MNSKYGLIRFVLLLCLMPLTSGCASLINGQEQTLYVKSHVNADIYINQRYAGQGVAKRSVQRDQAHTITVDHEGCQQSFTTQARFNRTSLLGVLLDLGLISIPIDFMSGAAWDVYPDKVILEPSC